MKDLFTLLHKFIRYHMGLLRKSKPENPFFLKPDIPDRYFCGREEETKDLIREAKSESRVVVLGPRRLGKTALLHHVAAQPEIQKRYNFIYIDLMNTNSMESFVNALTRAIENADILTHEKRRAKEIRNKYAANLKIKVGPVEAGLSAEHEAKKLDETVQAVTDVFDILSKTNAPNFIVFDEFQEILKYKGNEQGPFTGFLRSKIQFVNHSSFMFCGSDQHMLYGMFFSQNEPFFNSAKLYSVRQIPKEEYQDFCTRLLKDYKIDISTHATDLVYGLMQGNTKDMQTLMNDAFPNFQPGDTITKEKMVEFINKSINKNDLEYQTKYNLIVDGDPLKEKLLYCIVKEGVTEPLSEENLKKYGMKDDVERLEQIIRSWATIRISDENDDTRQNDKAILKMTSPDAYVISDRMFDLWMSKQVGTFDARIKNPEDINKKIHQFENSNRPLKEKAFKKKFGLK